MQVGVANTPPGQAVVANPYNPNNYPNGAPPPPPPGLVVVQTAPVGWNNSQPQEAWANQQIQQAQMQEYRKWRSLVMAALGT